LASRLAKPAAGLEGRRFRVAAQAA